MLIISNFTLFILICISFNCCNAQNTSSFTDKRDGHIYKTVKIGDKWWMAENLAYKTDSDSYVYNNRKIYEKIYGRLYTWKIATKACPEGWHLPTSFEWEEMEFTITINEAKQGFYLKSKEGWQDYENKNGNGNNSSGLRILPAGYRGYVKGTFYSLGKCAYFWTSAPHDKEIAWKRKFSYKKKDIRRFYMEQTYCFSVRCVKD